MLQLEDEAQQANERYCEALKTMEEKWKALLSAERAQRKEEVRTFQEMIRTLEGRLAERAGEISRLHDAIATTPPPTPIHDEKDVLIDTLYAKIDVIKEGKERPATPPQRRDASVQTPGNPQKNASSLDARTDRMALTCGAAARKEVEMNSVSPRRVRLASTERRRQITSRSHSPIPRERSRSEQRSEASPLPSPSRGYANPTRVLKIRYRDMPIPFGEAAQRSVEAAGRREEHRIVLAACGMAAKAAFIFRAFDFSRWGRWGKDDTERFYERLHPDVNFDWPRLCSAFKAREDYGLEEKHVEGLYSTDLAEVLPHEIFSVAVDFAGVVAAIDEIMPI